MKSDLVAELDILGSSCNSSKSNMATPAKTNHNFKKIKIESCTIPSFRTNLTSGIHFWHYLCDPKSRSNVTFKFIMSWNMLFLW